MEKTLAPIYSHLVFQVAFGLLVWANLTVFTLIRYRTLVRRFYVDQAALVHYQHSGFWLAAFLGFVASFLPNFLLPSSCFVVLVILINWRIVGRVEQRIYSETQTSSDR